MNRLKRLICAIVAGVILMMHSNPALAKFGGNLRSDMPWTLNISPETSTGFAATIIFVDSRGRQDIDMFTIQVNEQFTPYSAVNIPRGTRRIIIELDSPFSVGFSVRVIQGTNVIVVDACCESSRVVFDIV